MYVIRNHEIVVVVEYGNEHAPSSVGIEVVPPLTEGERALVIDWMNGHNKSVLSYLIDKFSHGDDASRYGETASVGDTSKLERKMGDLATGIRMGIESAGKFVSIEHEVRETKKDGILGS